MKPLEDRYALSRLNEILENRRGSPFTVPDRGTHVVLLLSGGMDSILFWGYCMDILGLHIHPIHIIKNASERKAVALFSQIYRTKFSGYFHNPVFKRYDWTFGFRETKGLEMNPAVLLENTNKASGASDIVNNPSRLGIFSFIGWEYALLLRYSKKIRIDTILTAIMPDDSLRDRSATLTALRSTNVALCTALTDYSWQFSGPLEKSAGLHITKKQLVRFAVKRGIPLHLTWSCHGSERNHCGKCGSCMGRKTLLRSMGIPDKTAYSPSSRSNALRRVATRGLQFIRRILAHPERNNHPGDIADIDRFSPHPGVTADYLKGEGVLLNRTTSTVVRLNAAGTLIWKLLEKNPASVRDAAKALVARFRIADRKAREDADAFIREMYKERFLRKKAHPHETG